MYYSSYHLFLGSQHSCVRVNCVTYSLIFLQNQYASSNLFESLFWSSLRGPLFSMKHAQNMLLKDDICIFIKPDIWNIFGEKEIHPLPGEELSFGLPRKSKQFLAKVRILASSNGLILCQSMSLEGQSELCICNPITQTWLPIPTPTTLVEDHYVNINVFFKCINRHLDLNDYLIFLLRIHLMNGHHMLISKCTCQSKVCGKQWRRFSSLLE